MGPGMFDGLVGMLITIGVLIGIAASVVTWAILKYVVPHIHWL